MTPRLRLVSSRDIPPDRQGGEDDALLCLMNQVSPAKQRILAMVMSHIRQMDDDEDAALALIDRVMTTLKPE